MQYCPLQHRTLLPVTSHIHNWVLFLLWLHLFSLSGVISPLISCSMLGSYWPGEFPFQVPMQYCSLQHQTLLLSPVTSATGYCFCFGSISSFFLELFLHWSPVAYWVPPDPGSSPFSILLFCLFILFIGFSRQECWCGLPFPSPVDYILSDFSTMTYPSWVAPQGMA